MTQPPLAHDDSYEVDDEMDAHLLEAARPFPYPPTPDIAIALSRKRSSLSPAIRRLMWAALIVLISLCGLLVIPEVRAAVLSVLRIGSVTIFTTPPTSTPTSLPSTAVLTDTPQPTATLLPSLLRLAGETTLQDAQAHVRFPIRLPTHPTDLGPPDHVYRQSMGGSVVILVWLDPTRADGVRLSLHLLSDGAMVYKMPPQVLAETSVHGQHAIWTEGPYLIEVKQGNQTEWTMRRLITGHVLIWAEGDVTYRLETDQELTEAVKIAESLR